MKFVVFVLAISAMSIISLAGSPVRIFMICNQLDVEVTFENKEDRRNTCKAAPGSACHSNRHPADIPNAESGQRFADHRLLLTFGGGGREYSIWRHHRDKAIYGGIACDDKGRGTLLGRYIKSVGYDIIIRADGSVFLTPHSTNCPKLSTASQRWDPPKGEWELIQSVSGGSDLSHEILV